MNSPIKWVGGKSKLTDTILPLFPDHRCYVEVFGGAAWLLFAKQPSQFEILNDYDSWLMNFWSVVKTAKDQFIKSFEYTLVSRELFNQYKEMYKSNSCDDAIQKVHIFYYLVMAGFAADMKNPVFGTSAGESRSRLNIEQIHLKINNAYKRLQGVTIENKSFEGMFSIYDTPDTFFYLDSPYRNTKQYAVGAFTDDQYRLLADCCRNAKGKWLYTINDDELIHELFKDFYIKEHDVYYSVSRDDEGRKDFKELIISNYKLPIIKQISLF